MFTALVPMGAHSERIPGKNRQIVGGKPLFHHILHTLQKCEAITKIVVNTDEEIIKNQIAGKFPYITIHDRPEHLRSGHIPMNEIIKYDLSHIDGQFFIQTHATNPFLTVKTINRALFAFQASGCDSLFSVTPQYKRFYDVEGFPVNHDLSMLERTQDLKPLMEENSCIYVFSRDSFAKCENRVGQNPHIFEMDKWESLDIDDKFDLEVARCLMKR